MAFKPVNFDAKLKTIVLHRNEDKDTIAQVAAKNSQTDILDYLYQCKSIPSNY